MSWGSDVLGITEETFSMVKAATAGIDTTTSIAGIDLLDDILSLVPVDTPFFNSTPRGTGKGSRAVLWQTLLNVNSGQSYRATPADQSGQIANIENQWIYSPYQSIGTGGRVTWDAIAQGEGQADVLAVDTLQTINQHLIKLEVNQLNALPFALPAIGNPTLSAATTGGSVGAVTVYVACAARSPYGWYNGGSGIASTVENTGALTGTTNSVAASVAPVKLAAGYDWWVGTASGALFYYTTTSVPSVTITSVPTTNAVVPGLTGLYGAGSAFANPISGVNTVPTTDTSYESDCTLGLLASILGDWASTPDDPFNGGGGSAVSYTTPGSGTPQGSYFADLAGAQLSVQGAGFTQIDAMNKAIYDKYQVSTSRMLMGSQVITDFANGFLDNPQAVTWLTPNAKDGRLAAVMGGHVATYANKTVNGKPIDLWLMPYLPPGMIVAVIDSLPFPGSNVTSSLQVRTQYDFFRFDYGANRVPSTSDGGPRYDFEIRSRQAQVNKAGPVMGVISGIGAGIA